MPDLMTRIKAVLGFARHDVPGQVDTDHATALRRLEEQRRVLEADERMNRSLGRLRDDLLR